MKRVPRILLVLFFLALLATPIVVQRYYRSKEPTPNVSNAIDRYGFFLEASAASAKVDFTHRSPKLDPKLDPIMPIIASMGASVSVVDFDRDGWNDLYLTNSGEDSLNALYKNNRDGTFTDVADQVGL